MAGWSDFARGGAAGRLIALGLAVCAAQATAVGQERDRGAPETEPVVRIQNFGGRVIIKKAVPARDAAEAAGLRFVDRAVLAREFAARKARLAADDTVVRAERARERMEARTAFLMADIARTTHADEEQVAALRVVLGGAAVRMYKQAQAGGAGFAGDWVERSWDQILDSEEWQLGLENTLTDEQRDTLIAAEDARAQRLFHARTEIAVVSLASELRLRRPQVEKLKPLIAAWVSVRAPKRAQLLAGDAVAEMIAVPHIREELSLEQMMRLMRMRSAKRAIILEDGAPGDDLGLGTGRYPEDDYALEICALAQYHGWDWEELDAMRGVGEMLARGLRRSKPRAWRNGARNLTRATLDVGGEPLWQAVLERERRARGTAEPAPSPVHADEQFHANEKAAYIDARAAFLVALLDERFLLSTAQREVLLGQLEGHAKYEYRRNWSGKVALDAVTNWTSLRLDEGRGARPRLALTNTLKGALDADQLIELGL